MTLTVQEAPFPPGLFQTGPSPMEIAVAAVVVVAAIGTFAVLLGFVRALQRKWAVAPRADETAIQELRHTVQQLSAEVGELQERVDFAERVLASRGEPDRIDRGGS